jgi:hypothetical protein
MNLLNRPEQSSAKRFVSLIKICVSLRAKNLRKLIIWPTQKNFIDSLWNPIKESRIIALMLKSLILAGAEIGVDKD